MKHIKPALLLLSLLTTPQFGCVKPDTEEEVKANPYAPESNHLILDEYLIGSDEKSSWFFASEKSYTSNNFYVLGELDAAQASTSISVGQTAFQDFFETVLIKVDRNGYKVWEKRPGFYCRSLVVIKPGLLTDKEVILLIGSDSNDADQGRTRIMLFDEDGNFLYNYSKDFLYYHNDIEMINNAPDHLEFISVGCVTYQSGKILPTFYRFKIRKTNIEFIEEDVSEVDYDKHTFNNVEIVGNKIIVSGTEEYSNPQIDPKNMFIQAYNLNMSPVWGYDINISNSKISHRSGQMTSSQDKVFLCFAAEDDEKDLSSAGDNWRSIYISSFDANSGTSNWFYKYARTDYSDFPLGIVYLPSNLYVCGMEAAHKVNDEYRALGFIARLNPENGQYINNARTFGDQYHGNAIETCIVNPDFTFAFGYVQKNDNDSKGWLFKVNTSSL